MEIKDVKTKKPKKKKKSGIKKAAIVILVLLLLAGILFVLTQTVLFKIKKVEIKGSKIYSPQEIADASKISAGDLLFSVNNENKCKNITATLPYIKTVSVGQKIPDTLVITVTDDTAAYQIEDNGIYFLADKDYKILEQTDKEKEGLILIIGSGIKSPKPGQKAVFEDKTKLDVLENLVKKCDTYENMTLSKIDLTDNVYLNFTVNKTVDVKLGSTTEIDYKLSHLSGMLKELPINVRGEVNLESYTAK
ncbi:MAG: FtsQ-type POTRA domain-containing protein, partial [Oscillospiraceae bacterium]|nr:FtsQ-type POTRA domain-containing protein [Candidatus Equicaccousia limihippi]